jgi:hypothetical protein|tara:strand:- start:78674 stop:79303 length:630 start_codon:yes stop_codon:yes gene_type:complete
MFDTVNYSISLFLVFFVIASYVWCRHLGKIKDRAYGDMARIDVAMQRRHKFGPEIIQICDKFMDDQRELISDAVAMLLEPVPAPYIYDITGLRRYIMHGEKLGEVMHFMLALAPQYPAYHDYPELKKLMDDYYANEREIGQARIAYNQAVSNVRVNISLFPANLYAGIVRVKALPELKDTEAHDMRGATIYHEDISDIDTDGEVWEQLP